MKYDNILQTIGNTPVVKLNRIAPAGIVLPLAWHCAHWHRIAICLALRPLAS